MLRVLSLFAAVALARAENKVEVLDDLNYSLFIGASTPVFVKFYAPWCGHCKKMAPAWKELGASTPSSKMVIADADCTEENSKKLCAKFGVTGFPTIKFFAKNDEAGEDYNGGRDTEGLQEFVDGHLGGSCAPDNLEACSAQQAEYIETWVAKDKDEAQKELSRLEAIEGKRGQTPEQRKWFKSRLNLLKKIVA